MIQTLASQRLVVPRFSLSRQQPVGRSLLASVALAAALGASAPAGALTISANFDNVDAASQAVINNVLAGYAATFSDPITVYIQFAGMNAGLGQSSTYSYTRSYADYITALRADASSAADATALASIPAGTNNPVLPGQTNIDVTRAQLNAVGIAQARPTDVNNLPTFDSVISLNFSLMNTTRNGVIDPNKYDLQSTVQHEVNEVLGTVSNVGDSTTEIRPIDLFRYASPGGRSFGARSDPAYLSIDGGTSNLAGYNSRATGDTGDFDSVVVRVQNAFGTPGATTVQLGVELTALDVVGFTVAVPEPETYAMMLAGLLSLAALSRRRRQG